MLCYVYKREHVTFVASCVWAVQSRTTDV